LEASNGLPKLSIGTSNSNEGLLEASNAHHCILLCETVTSKN